MISILLLIFGVEVLILIVVMYEVYRINTDLMELGISLKMTRDNLIDVSRDLHNLDRNIGRLVAALEAKP